jgi:DNA-binding transcriptional regulator GbsR (MarR family)
MTIDLTKIFGKTAQIEVLENLILHKGDMTYLSGIAEETGLSHASVSRVMKPLTEVGIATESMLGKQVRIFKLDEESEATKIVLDFYEKIGDL